MTTPLDDLGLPKGYAFRPQFEITPRMAQAALAAATPSILLVDCRTQAEFDLVHIPGSVHIPLSDIEARADEIDPAPGQAVAVICHHGVRSMKAMLALRQLGHPGTMSVAGGIDAWSMGADAALPRYERDGAKCRLLR